MKTRTLPLRWLTAVAALAAVTCAVPWLPAQVLDPLARAADPSPKPALLVADITRQMRHAQGDVQHTLALGDPATIATWARLNHSRFDRVEQLVAQLQAATDGERLGKVLSLAVAWRKLRVGLEREASAVAAGDLRMAADINRGEVRVNTARAFEALAQLNADPMAEARREVDLWYLSAVSLVVAALGVLVALGALVWLALWPHRQRKRPPCPSTGRP